MWDVDTIKKLNTRTLQHYRVYEVGAGRFALGFRNSKALAVVQRFLAKGGRGRPHYAAVRGVRPFIGPEAAVVKPSKLLRASLVGN